MTLARKAASVTSCSLLALVIVFREWKDTSTCEMSSPLNLTGNVGEDIIFKFNSTRGNPILAVTFGLDGNESYPVPKFMTLININGNLKMTLGNDLNNLAANYNGRVRFVGDLDKGRAWFHLSNLSSADSNVYLASIREDCDETYGPAKKFKLKVPKTDIILPSENSEAKFTQFEGIAVKKGRSYSIMDEDSQATVYAAITEAYPNASMIHEIEINIRKTKRTLTVTSWFNLTFTEPVNRTYALSFLQEAQQNNQLRGFDITCFDPKPSEKPTIEKLDPKPNEPGTVRFKDKTSYLVVIILPIVFGILVAAGFPIYYFYKKQTHPKEKINNKDKDVLPKTSGSSPPALPP